MKQFDKWVKLTPLFSFMENYLKSNKLNNVFVSTSNRKSTVSNIFKYYNIKFSEENIFDNKTSLDKKEHVRIIKKRENIDYTDIYFVDDQVRILIDMKKLGVRCFLAGWGYNNQEQKKEAVGNGIEVIDKENFGKIM